MNRDRFPTVMCPCGCGEPASDHPHPFGVTPEHRAWCRKLDRLGYLRQAHRRCAR